jgi:hypothetical protein
LLPARTTSADRPRPDRMAVTPRDVAHDGAALSIARARRVGAAPSCVRFGVSRPLDWIVIRSVLTANHRRPVLVGDTNSRSRRFGGCTSRRRLPMSRSKPSWRREAARHRGGSRPSRLGRRRVPRGAPAVPERRFGDGSLPLPFPRSFRQLTLSATAPRRRHLPLLRLWSDGRRRRWVCETEGVRWREAIQILDSGRGVSAAWSGPESESDIRNQSGSPARTHPFRHVVERRVPGPISNAGAVRVRRSRHRLGVLQLRRAPRPRCRLPRTTPDRPRRPRELHGPSRGWPQRDEPRRSCHRHAGEGFTRDELVDAGLAHRREDGRLTDFYRERMLIPIRNEDSRICGFVGRNVGDDGFPSARTRPVRPPTTSPSPFISRSPAPTTAMRGQVVVGEGTLDAMAIAPAAIRADCSDEFCPMTQSGREMSWSQLAVVSAHAKPIVLAFDGDAAGRDSAVRHASAAIHSATPIWVSILPGDHGPASWFMRRRDEGLRAWTIGAPSHSLGPIRAQASLADTCQRRLKTDPLPPVEY